MFLVIDIGATKTLIAIFSKHGHCTYRYKFPTNHSDTVFLEDLKKHLSPLADSDIQQVIIAVPGIVQKNYTFDFGNLPWSPNIPIIPLLKTLFSCKISVFNDADLATIYESSYYSGKTIYLTFSTGVGGGIAKNGILTPFSTHFEPGHILYRYHTNLIEWEDFASSNAIKRIYYTQVSDLKNTSKINQDLIERLLPGLIDITKQHHPDDIVIGGAVGDILPRFSRQLSRSLKQSLPASSPLPKIHRAKRPYESVIYGGYTYAKKLQ